MSDQTIPAAEYDSPWKEALARYLPDALALFFPAAHAEIDWTHGYEVLDNELQQVARDAELGRRLADTLVKVWRSDGSDAWVIIHIEVQGSPERDFAKRMFVYHYRIFDRYDRPVLSVAILGDEQPDWRPDRFVQELWGCRVALEYPVVKLSDWWARDAELATSENLFAVVVRSYLVARARAGNVAGRSTAKLGLIRSLYQRGFDRAQVLELFRLINWLVVLPDAQEQALRQEVLRIEEEDRMPYITPIERLAREEGEEVGRQQGEEIGRQQGEEIGRQQGEEIGRRDGARLMLRRMVRARLGSVPEAFGRRIDAADDATLEALADRVVGAASLAELTSDPGGTASAR